MNTYSILLNTSGIATIDDVNEGKGIWQIINDNVVHNLWFSNTRTVNNNYSILKRETKHFFSKSKGQSNMESEFSVLMIIRRQWIWCCHGTTKMHPVSDDHCPDKTSVQRKNLSIFGFCYYHFSHSTLHFDLTDRPVADPDLELRGAVLILGFHVTSEKDQN